MYRKEMKRQNILYKNFQYSTFLYTYLMFSLSFLFITLPLYFSHIFMHFGIVIWEGPSFERQKMYLFILTVFIALIEMILTRYERLIVQVKKYWLILLWLLLLPFVSMFLYGGQIDAYWIRGSFEKFHGYILYVGIIVLGFCLSLLRNNDKRKLVIYSLIPVVIVSVIAILEALSFQVFFPPSASVWWEGIRAISTLGNPNYLAGYLLLMLPISAYIRFPERFIIAFLILAALVATRSYIGITIAVIYILYISAHMLMKKYSQTLTVQILILSSVIFGFIILWYHYIPTEKLLSLSWRFVLMWELLLQLIQFPLWIITGLGPEAILRFFSESRSVLVDSYFPRDSLIDSSHNILLDLVFQYGIIPIILFGYYINKNWKTWNSHARVSSLLGIVFLLFNPYVVMHLALLTLTLSLYDDRK